MLYPSRPGLPDRNSFVQGTDGKRLLHPVPRFPADTPTRIQIDNHHQIQLARASPDIPDIRTPFLIRSLTAEVLIAHVGSTGSTVCCALTAALLTGFATICTHYPCCSVAAHRNTCLIQRDMPARAVIIRSARQRKLVANMCKDHHLISSHPAGGDEARAVFMHSDR